MKKNFTFSLLILVSIICLPAMAQKGNNLLLPGEVYLNKKYQFKKSYFSNGFEGGIFSTALFERPGRSSGATTLRFTSFFHLGYLYNYNFNHTVGIMTGLSLKNIGFIDKYPTLDSTVKRRLYTLNVPFAFKFGQLQNNKFFFVGAEASLAVNYKEKGFVHRNKKQKFNEWFSNRTPLLMPNVFIGYQTNNIYFKMNYYPTNFLNTDFVDPKTGLKPYAGYKVNILAFTVGFNIPTRPLHD